MKIRLPNKAPKANVAITLTNVRHPSPQERGRPPQLVSAALGLSKK
jgi:hypothetical protein